MAPQLAVEKVDMLNSRVVNSREAIADRSGSWSAEVAVASAHSLANYRVKHISSRYAWPLTLARSGVRHLESFNINSCLVPRMSPIATFKRLLEPSFSGSFVL